MNLEPATYGPAMAALLKDDRLSPLGPGEPNLAARTALESLNVENAFAHATVRDHDMAAACLAGLWLYHDDLDEAHNICQNIETPTGSYWHGIMHRREPDYSNSKYWFRRVDAHPIFEPLRVAAAELARQDKHDAAAGFLGTQTSWDPFGFVDLCARAAGGQSTSEMLCRHIQQREWELLFDHCYQNAVG